MTVLFLLAAALLGVGVHQLLPRDPAESIERWRSRMRRAYLLLVTWLVSLGVVATMALV